MVFDVLSENPSLHAHTSPRYADLQRKCRSIISSSDLRLAEPKAIPFGPFGDLILPYHRMGAIDSLDLFGIDELVIFAFYRANQQRYQRCVDIGANIGLHSIVMARCGFAVRAYEPDPVHYEILARNLALNHADVVVPVMAAVSDLDGTMEFVRVKGNTTGSHLVGAKANPYGALDRFPVTVVAAAAAVEGAGLVKVDAEGHEATILRSIPTSRWTNLDAIVEVGSVHNAHSLFEHFQKLGVGLFAQKLGWASVEKLQDMPTSYRDGSVFVSRKREMPWR